MHNEPFTFESWMLLKTNGKTLIIYVSKKFDEWDNLKEIANTSLGSCL